MVLSARPAKREEKGRADGWFPVLVPYVAVGYLSGSLLLLRSRVGGWDTSSHLNDLIFRLVNGARSSNESAMPLEAKGGSTALVH